MGDQKNTWSTYILGAIFFGHFMEIKNWLEIYQNTLFSYPGAIIYPKMHQNIRNVFFDSIFLYFKIQKTYILGAVIKFRVAI